MIKRLFFDVETTGLNHMKSAIHQLAFLLELDGEIVSEGNFKLKPFNGAVIEKAALDKCRVTEEELNSYPDQRIAYDKFIEVLDYYCNKYDKKDKITLIGYRSRFDNDYVNQFFQRNGNNFMYSYFWGNDIDVSTIASLALENERVQMDDFKLITVCKRFNIDMTEDEAHDALYDVQKTRELFYKCKNNFINK